jgi:hypothetical protein
MSDAQLGGTGYWVLGIRYWCLLELNPNFIYLHMVNYKNRKKILYTST